MKIGMMNRIAVCAVSVAALTFGVATWQSANAGAGCGSCGWDKASADKKEKTKDVVDIAASNGDFTTLVAAVKAAGLVDTLKGDGPFTVFAPTNAAFNKLPEGTVEDLLKPENRDQLVAILTYHVVPGKVTAEQVVELDEATTVHGQKLRIMTDDGKVKINNAKVVKTDIMGSNGVIHVIDTVLLPPTATASAE